LDIPADLEEFKTVLYIGFFRAFEPDQRKAFARDLVAVVPSGERLFPNGFGEGATEDARPNPLALVDIYAAFETGWKVKEI
jgi:hypothetical protein